MKLAAVPVLVVLALSLAACGSAEQTEAASFVDRAAASATEDPAEARRLAEQAVAEKAAAVEAEKVAAEEAVVAAAEEAAAVAAAEAQKAAEDAAAAAAAEAKRIADEAAVLAAAEAKRVADEQAAAVVAAAEQEADRAAAAAAESVSVSFANCSEARAAGAAPVYRGDPGYASHLDRDDDGVGCES